MPLLVLAAASSYITARAQLASKPGLEGLRLTGRLENATVSYAIYLFKTIWPVNLAIYYPHPLHAYNGADPLPVGQVVAAAMLLAAVTCAAILLRKRPPYVLAGWVWYLVALVPVIGLFQSGDQAYADRFTYLPHIGILAAICWGVADLAEIHARAALWASAVVAAVLALLSWHQLSYWHDPQVLWRHALKVTGPNPLALICLAETLEDGDAADYYRKAIEIDPQSADAHMSLGNIYLRAGRFDDATREQEEAVRIVPESEGVYCNLGNIELRRGRYDRAADYFRQQLQRRESSEAHGNLGSALSYQGRLADAEQELKEAVRLDPDSVSAHANLGGLLRRLKRLDEAALAEEKAIQLAPRLYEPHYQLAMIEIERSNYARAVECLRTALRLRPGSFDALSGLGAALLQQGQVNEALPVLTEAVRARPQDGPARYNVAKALEVSGNLEGAASQYELATHSPLIWRKLGTTLAASTFYVDDVAKQSRASSKRFRGTLLRSCIARRLRVHAVGRTKWIALSPRRLRAPLSRGEPYANTSVPLSAGRENSWLQRTHAVRSAGTTAPQV